MVTNEQEEQIRRIQIATGMDDEAWAVNYGNERGLLGMFELARLDAKIEELEHVFAGNREIWWSNNESEQSIRKWERIADLTTVNARVDLAKASVEDLEYLRDMIEEELEVRSQNEMKESLEGETK